MFYLFNLIPNSFIFGACSYYESNSSCGCLLELESRPPQFTPLSIIAAYPALPSPARYADEGPGPAGSGAGGEADTGLRVKARKIPGRKCDTGGPGEGRGNADDEGRARIRREGGGGMCHRSSGASSVKWRVRMRYVIAPACAVSTPGCTNTKIACRG